jgi:hypothetical protein
MAAGVGQQVGDAAQSLQQGGVIPPPGAPANDDAEMLPEIFEDEEVA